MITRNVARLFAALVAFAGLGAGFRPTLGGRPVPEIGPHHDRPFARRGRGGPNPEHRAEIAALRSRPVGRYSSTTQRNAAKRYRQGRASWADVERAERTRRTVYRDATITLPDGSTVRGTVREGGR